MKPRPCALGVALAAWGLALAVVAEEVPPPVGAIEPSLLMFRALDVRAELTDEQRALFEPYFRSHGDRLRDMKLRLNAGELSYIGAVLEGHALRRDLDARALEWLDDSQFVAFGEIRQELRSRFREMFFREEHAWLLRLFGRSDATPPTEKVALSDGGNS